MTISDKCQSTLTNCARFLTPMGLYHKCNPLDLMINEAIKGFLHFLKCKNNTHPTASLNTSFTDWSMLFP